MKPRQAVAEILTKRRRYNMPGPGRIPHRQCDKGETERAGTQRGMAGPQGTLRPGQLQSHPEKAFYGHGPFAPHFPLLEFQFLLRVLGRGCRPTFAKECLKGRNQLHLGIIGIVKNAMVCREERNDSEPLFRTSDSNFAMLFCEKN